MMLRTEPFLHGVLGGHSDIPSHPKRSIRRGLGGSKSLTSTLELKSKKYCFLTQLFSQIVQQGWVCTCIYGVTMRWHSQHNSSS
jgi:hypothetical protein